MTNIKKPWIEKGYQEFAFEGPHGLKVERLSKAIGKNKASFYHHFSGLEIFTNALLDFHLEQALILAEKESICTSLQ